jgi:hypothetical protein
MGCGIRTPVFDQEMDKDGDQGQTGPHQIRLPSREGDEATAGVVISRSEGHFHACADPSGGLERGRKRVKKENEKTLAYFPNIFHLRCFIFEACFASFMAKGRLKTFMPGQQGAQPKINLNYFRAFHLLLGRIKGDASC